MANTSVLCPNCGERRDVKGIGAADPSYPMIDGEIVRRCRTCANYSDGMTQAERLLEVRRLRSGGMTYPEIGARFDKSSGWAYETYRMAVVMGARLFALAAAT